MGLVWVSCPRCHVAFQSDDADREVPRCSACGEPTTVNHPVAAALEDTGPDLIARPAAVGPLPAVDGHEILAVLGRGGMGVVYKARHLRLKRLVALKMILAAEHAGADQLARFKAEAEAVARLQHANVVQIHEVGEQNGRPFFSLEYLDGGSLAQKLASGPMPPREAAQVVETLARAMHAAHRLGIIHRDLKPANVLLTADGTPKITDFGLAKQLDADSGQTQTGAIMGTPSYMAPEQAAGRVQDVGPAADVYALGAVLYEALTGRPPFRGFTPLETIEQVLGREPVPPAQLQPACPRDLDTICLKCLEKDRLRRYPSAGDLADDLARYLADQPIQARPTSLVYRFRKFTVRRKALVLGTAGTLVMLILAVIGTSIGMIWANQARNQADQARAQAEQALKQAEEANGKTNKALVEEQRALAKSKRALANSQADKAVREGRDGHWVQALAQYDAALQNGPDDVVAVELGRLDCYGALLQMDKLQAALDALAARPDLGKYRGAVLLARARYALIRPDAKTDEALDLLRQALAAGLSEADEAFARALLAKTVPEAVEYMQRAADKGRFDSSVMDILVPLLIMLGRFDEAQSYVARFKLISPDSATVRFEEGLLYALKDDMPKANALLAGLDEKSAAQATRARRLLELINRAARGDYQWQMISPTEVLKSLAGGNTLTDVNFGPDLHRMMQLPFLSDLPKHLTSAAFASALGRHAAKADALAEILRIAPDGMVYLAYAQALFASGRLDEAEQALLKAINRRSVFEARQRARFELVNLRMERQSRSGKKADEALRRQLVADLQQVQAMGPVPPAIGNDIAGCFLLLGEPALGLAAIEERLRRSPPDVTALYLRAMSEFALGAYPRVLATCREIFRRNPNDKRATKYQSMAQQAIKNLQDGKAPTPPKKP